MPGSNRGRRHRLHTCRDVECCGGEDHEHEGNILRPGRIRTCTCSLSLRLGWRKMAINRRLILPTNVRHYHPRSNHNPSTYSGVSRRRKRSIAAENTANPRPPQSAPLGPVLRARTPPAINPAAIGFTISFRARYYAVHHAVRNISQAFHTRVMPRNKVGNRHRVRTRGSAQTGPVGEGKAHRLDDTLCACKQYGHLGETLPAPPHAPPHFSKNFPRLCSCGDGPNGLLLLTYQRVFVCERGGH